MKKLALQVVALSAMTAGCATSPLQPSLGGEGVSVPRAAQCAFTREYREIQNCCVMKPYRSEIDVDTAYARVVREYGFNAKPKIYELEGEAYPDVYHGHRHEVQPGEIYLLQGIVVPGNGTQLFRGVWLALALRKAESGTTDVESVYCEVGARAMQDQMAWHAAVQRSIKATIPSRHTDQ
jgi:hypothetical protein